MLQSIRLYVYTSIHTLKANNTQIFLILGLTLGDPERERERERETEDQSRLYNNKESRADETKISDESR